VGLELLGTPANAATAFASGGSGRCVFLDQPRVRLYSLFVTAALIGGITASLLVLAGTVADVAWLRGVLVAGLLLALLTLMVRIASGILGATQP
jgi:hypothetical protein